MSDLILSDAAEAFIALAAAAGLVLLVLRIRNTHDPRRNALAFEAVSVAWLGVAYLLAAVNVLSDLELRQYGRPGLVAFLLSFVAYNMLDLDHH